MNSATLYRTEFTRQSRFVLLIGPGATTPVGERSHAMVPGGLNCESLVGECASASVRFPSERAQPSFGAHPPSTHATPAESIFVGEQSFEASDVVSVSCGNRRLGLRSR